MNNLQSFIISNIIKCSDSIRIIQEILNKINTHKLDNNKFFKHDPFSTEPENIKSVQIKNNKIIIKYKNIGHQQTILFDYNNEKRRSFSLVNDKNEHINLIQTQLNMQINQLNLWIGIFKNILIKTLNNAELNNYDNYNINIFSHDIKDIIYTHVENNNSNNIEYYISICPINAFELVNNKIYIANQYMLKFENCKFNLFYKHGDKFKKLLHRPELKDMILQFNNSEKSVGTENFLIIIENMRPITNKCLSYDDKTLCFNRFDNIDEPYVMTCYDIIKDKQKLLDKKIINTDDFIYTQLYEQEKITHANV